MNNHPHAAFPNSFFIHGYTAKGTRVYYTNQPGDAFISVDGYEARRYNDRVSAQKQVDILNAATNGGYFPHRVNFEVLPPPKKNKAVIDTIDSMHNALLALVNGGTLHGSLARESARMLASAARTILLEASIILNNDPTDNP